MRRTVEVAPKGPRPSISLRPAPPCEPPFDDELEPAVWVSAHQLALDWSPAALAAASAGPAALAASADRAALAASADPAASSTPELAVGLSPGPGMAAGAPFGSWPGGGLVTVAARPAVVAGASHDARLAVHRFVRMCVEVLNGHRPPAQLRRLSVPANAPGVVAQAFAGARRVADLRRAAAPRGRRPAKRPAPVAVIQLRLCEPRPGAVEAAVALVMGERTWAMALRMELHHDAWSATILRLI